MPTIQDEHAEMVRALVKDPALILNEKTPFKCDLDHMQVGICGEAGELADAIKKYTTYNQILDVINIIEELGDLEFYMQHLREILNLTREECLQANMEKLAKRYEDFKYTDKQAEQRKDKNTEVDYTGLYIDKPANL